MMKVQVFVQVLLLCSLHELVWSASDLAGYRNNQQACIKELKIPAAEASLITADKEVTNGSEAFKCFHQCLYKKMGLINADGTANNENIIKFAQARFSKTPLDKIKAELMSCSTSTPKTGNSCEYINKLEQCIAKALA